LFVVVVVVVFFSLSVFALSLAGSGAQSDRSVASASQSTEKFVLRDGKRVPQRAASKEYSGRDSHDMPGFGTSSGTSGRVASKRASMYHTTDRRGLADRKYQTLKAQRKASDTELDEVRSRTFIIGVSFVVFCLV
jgi:hypothetical protein